MRELDSAYLPTGSIRDLNERTVPYDMNVRRMLTDTSGPPAKHLGENVVCVTDEQSVRRALSRYMKNVSALDLVEAILIGTGDGMNFDVVNVFGTNNSGIDEGDSRFGALNDYIMQLEAQFAGRYSAHVDHLPMQLLRSRLQKWKESGIIYTAR